MMRINHLTIAVLLLLPACVPARTLETQPSPIPSPRASTASSALTVTALINFTPTLPPSPSASTPAATTELAPTGPAASTPVLPTLPPGPGFSLCTPLEDHTLTELEEIVTFPFDPPPPGRDDGHHGVDFAYYRRGDRLSIEGVPIQSVLPGQVAGASLNRPPYGNMVIIETAAAALPQALANFLNLSPGQSVYLLYAHMRAAPFVEIGQAVTCGQSLGEVGNTPAGWSSAPHLHLEVRVGPAAVVFDSLAFYTTSATTGELENYTRWRTSGDFQMFDPLLFLSQGLP